ncbi:hypothetical protein ACFLXN_02740 [Chloroflexota bacterium]
MESIAVNDHHKFETIYSKVMHPYVVYAPAVILIAYYATTNFIDWAVWSLITLALLYFFSSGYVYLRIRSMKKPDGSRIHSREFFRERTGEMLVPSLLFIVPAALGLYLLNGPVSLLALVISVGGAMLIVVLSNYFYRASLHLSSTTSIMTALGLTFGVICIVVLPLILLLGYARYRLGEHTIPQMIAGSAIGIGCAFGVFYGLGV